MATAIDRDYASSDVRMRMTPECPAHLLFASCTAASLTPVVGRLTRHTLDTVLLAFRTQMPPVAGDMQRNAAPRGSGCAPHCYFYASVAQFHIAQARPVKL